MALPKFTSARACTCTRSKFSLSNTLNRFRAIYLKKRKEGEVSRFEIMF